MSFPLAPYYAVIPSAADFAAFAVTGKAVVPLAAVADIPALKAFLKSVPQTVDVKVDIFATDAGVDQAVELLNSGVSQVFVAPKLAAQLVEAGIPAARLAVEVASAAQIAEIPAESAIFVNETVAATLEPLSRLVYVSFERSTDVYAAVKLGYTAIVCHTKLTTNAAEEPSKVSLAAVLLSKLVTDRPDGLYTTLVNDVQGKSLGLVYSSQESISEAIRTGTGVYQSRRHGLWYKGATSGDTQKLITLSFDCDGDCLVFTVEQSGVGFCHLAQSTCFGNYSGLARLEKTLLDRKANALPGSYTQRLFSDEVLLAAKIKEEAEELTEAVSKDEVAWECADLIYFALTKCVKEGVSLADVERNLDIKGLKVTRRKGDAKPKFLPAKAEAMAPAELTDSRIVMKRLDSATATSAEVAAALQRPVQQTSDIMKLVQPIIDLVKTKGDVGILELTEKFDHVKLASPVLRAPFASELMELTPEIKSAIDISIANVEKFHTAQLTETLEVETCPGVVCSRFARPVETVGLYVPGGTAVLPSTSLMLGVPAKVAGCKNIILASPPRQDGTLTPEVVYVAHKIGAKAILLAGGAQAVAAMAYGTESVPKCDKIMGPGNQFVTAAKMHVQNDTSALCSIDMPAGPSEVLVICDGKADPDFVASDLLSQAEHGVDSQVILLAVDMTAEQLEAVDEAVHRQALVLPRVEIVRKCIAHSTTLLVSSYEAAIALSNQYAPEHLILQIEEAKSWVAKVNNAGSIFVGAYSPESCGDYSSGTNHTLPTYGYAKMYSGVNTATFQKFITSQDVSPAGLKSIGHAVMTLAAVEGLEGHRNAVKVRMDKLGLL
ncbi:hypothetical protein BABINDRAFT_162081 [Babjeviella inositovora NRRL Y-12698]|uniref:Histidine biosynthesis trifunctional protein n=1 Tax=Babjeviella inositovora NRRL Y-12698 TaxID=984486 RepID=A0A1E3QPW1_9ASCO|nr:uncharacterized protein BABINDRAFT_162081 [Babjeviella inositovora NRRL Y-12698]ODQ79007.1 hypothetical protein BABINDRAFT_162081 [Babjeviella inositovora NRRL Y-12698]